jgi:hypothetical protein
MIVTRFSVCQEAGIEALANFYDDAKWLEIKILMFCSCCVSVSPIHLEASHPIPSRRITNFPQNIFTSVQFDMRSPHHGGMMRGHMRQISNHIKLLQPLQVKFIILAFSIALRPKDLRTNSDIRIPPVKSIQQYIITMVLC